MSVWSQAATAEGRTYYWHTKTKETRWDKPDDFDAPATPATPQVEQATIDASWKETKAANGRLYYYNAVTRETKWEAPEAYIKQEQQHNTRPQAPAFVAGGGQAFGGDNHPASERRMERRDDRDHHLPQKPSFEGGRGGGNPWENRQENTGFRGPMPVKTDEPEYATPEQAEEAFFKLLKKHNVTPDTPWTEALRMVVQEREYRALKDPRERRQAYEKYCVEVRAQEKGKEKERRERLRDDFRKMLSTHEDIKYYTRWKTARPLIEREAVYRSAGDDDERRQMFDEYVSGLKRKHAEDEADTHRVAMRELDGMFGAMITDADTKWTDAQAELASNERFMSDDMFRSLKNVDMLSVFETHIKELDRAKNEAKQQEKRTHFRRERRARDAFKQLLNQMLEEGQIKAGTKWQYFYPLIAEDERYVNLIGMPGSSPLDLFWDVVEDEERKLRSKRNDALDVLEDRRFEMVATTTMQEFASLMQSDPRTEHFDEEQMNMIYNRLMEKVLKRAEDERAHAERHQRKAIDTLRSVIKHLEPPVRVSDSYEDVASRLVGNEEYEVLDEEGRRSAFDRHVRRLREKEVDDAERDRLRRDRDRERDRDRDTRDRRDRRHRTRTPEVDAYEADRRKAQADRERQYRKPSFGLTPPPRERRDRDDRYERDGRRSEKESIYDRERRQREMERERSYIDRADPRHKGRTLDYGDEDAVGSRPGSIRKRRESEGSGRETKRSRRGHTRTPEADPVLKEDPPALQSGSEEGEIEEI